MALKYKSEIDNFNFDIVCPHNVNNIEDDVESYRFCFDPITHNLNFLPNVVFDRLTNSPFNYNRAQSNTKCTRCGASYYTSLDNAKYKWDSLTEQVRENLGYTHIASGILDSSDGLVSAPNDDGHFNLYENDTANLVEKFEIVFAL